MIRTAFPAALLVCTAAVHAAPLPPDRQWHAVDNQREEQLLCEEIAACVEQLALAQAYLEELLETLDVAAPEERGRALQAVRRRLGHAREALTDLAGQARWLAQHRAGDPVAKYLGDHAATPLARLARQDLELTEQALGEFDRCRCNQGPGQAVGRLALEALTGLRRQLAAVEAALHDIQETRRISRLLDGKGVRWLLADPLGNRGLR